MAEGAKKSPELIQLLELHTQFASITPYTQVGKPFKRMKQYQKQVIIAQCQKKLENFLKFL